MDSAKEKVGVGRPVLAALAALLLGGCASVEEYVDNFDAERAKQQTADAVRDYGGIAAGTVGGYMMARQSGYFKPEFIAGALVAYAIYDPFSPTWEVRAAPMGEDVVRFDLAMKRLVTGGEGEARQVLMRNARQVAQEGGYAGFDILRYEEGIESTRPFAHRVASAEIRLVKSRQFPEF